MSWAIVLAGPARRLLKRLPKKERNRLLDALAGMAEDPFAGDVRHLQGTAGYRRRVGDWRILFTADTDRGLVLVTAIIRRASNTY